MSILRIIMLVNTDKEHHYALNFTKTLNVDSGKLMLR